MRRLIVLFSFLSLYTSANPFTFYTAKSGLINSNVYCIEKGSKFIWVGTSTGINRITFKKSIPIEFSKRGTSVPVTALEDDGEIIWAGLKGKGVYQMLKKNYKLIGFRKDVLVNKEILEIKRIKKGIIVLTSNQKFTFSFGKSEYSVSEIKTENHHPEIRVGRNTIKNNNGILSRYNPETKSFRPFKNQIHSRDHLNWYNGVLLATSKGLVFYNPDMDTIRFGSPKLELLRFQLNGSDTIPNNLDLSWNEYKFNYQFHFEELGGTNQIMLAYTLNNGSEVIDKTVAASEGIELSDLEYGNYQLKIRAKNQKGIESKNTLQYSFSIANPLMNSIWRYIVVIFLIGIWTFLVVLIIKSRHKKEMKILEDALLEKTNKLNQIEKSKYGLVDEDKVQL
ncbi:MAG: hypothetical protein CMD35_05655 [Flavobacteriales bacterium]|nr:hypothetical protein [Flavobacteriales bacterium]